MTLHYANDIPYINDLEPELVNSWLEIDLNAIGKNITYLKSLIPKSGKIMAVVKADAYGHGAIEVAFKAQDIKIVDYLGVANIAEAKILRQSGVYLPILVLGSTFDEQLHIALKYNIETTITSYVNIQILEKIAKELNIQAKVHLKIDSGMGRVGIRPEKLEESLILLKKSKHIILKGVFTHFAESENINSNFTDQQIDTFENCLKIIKETGFKNFIIHSANSSATLICTKSHFDMVREGLAMYGIGDPENDQLLVSLSLKSRIINIKEVPKGSSLGYGRSFFTQVDSLIGIVPIGYADGLPRILSNNQDVIVNDHKFPLVGNISMDQCLVDLTSTKNNIENIKIGDEVILIGKSKNQSIKVQEWANKSYKISYEVLCGFGNRLPRKYID